MANIHLRNIHVYGQNRLILDIPSAELPCKRITAVIGPNGAGKTTLLKVIAGLITQPEFQIQHHAHSISMVLSQTPLIKMSVLGNFLILRDAKPDLTIDQIDLTLRSFQLDHLKHQAATRLSTGEKQRLAIARAYLMGAELLILDEPTASLDPQSTLLIESKITELAQGGMRFLIASHDFAQVKRICDHVVFVKDGHIAECGMTTSFFSSAQTPAAQEFLSLHV